MPFDLNASAQVSADSIAAFISAPIGHELTDIPGIGM